MCVCVYMHFYSECNSNRDSVLSYTSVRSNSSYLGSDEMGSGKGEKNLFCSSVNIYYVELYVFYVSSLAHQGLNETIFIQVQIWVNMRKNVSVQMDNTAKKKFNINNIS